MKMSLTIERWDGQSKVYTGTCAGESSATIERVPRVIAEMSAKVTDACFISLTNQMLGDVNFITNATPAN